MKRHGQGEYTYPNLDQLNEEKANNPNMIIDKYDLDRKLFSGEWIDDEKVRGVILSRSGEKYEGQSFKDQPDSMGVTKFKDGNVYQGDFQDGLKNRSGI